MCKASRNAKIFKRIDEDGIKSIEALIENHIFKAKRSYEFGHLKAFKNHTETVAILEKRLKLRKMATELDQGVYIVQGNIL